MQTSRPYPFERNRYFYGKLLTVRDFESEQTYMNQKRWLLNRLLHGVGVVTGLQVTPAGERKITVNAGLAFDYQGREIIVEERQTLDLSTVHGFQNNGDYAKIVYLCLAYEESGKEMVHSVANSARKEEVSEYNRSVESYKLLIQEEAPSLQQFEATNLAYSTAVLHEDRDVRILHQVPLFAEVNDRFHAKVLVQRISQQRHVKLSFHVTAEGCVVEGKASGEPLVFEKEFDSGEYNAEFTYDLRTLPPAAGTTTGQIAIKASDVNLYVMGNEVSVSRSAKHEFTVSYDALHDQIVQRAYSRALEDVLQAPSDQCLYLAQIHLQPWGASYKVDSIVPVPFFEQVHNASLLFNLGLAEGGSAAAKEIIDVQADMQALSAGEAPHLDVAYDLESRVLKFTLGLPEVKVAAPPKRVTTGFTDLFLMEKQKVGLFGKLDRTYITDEISHGLGAGVVMITTAIEASDSLLASEERVVFGDADVFQETDCATELPKLSIGTMLYPNRGTFQIGVKLHHSTELGKIRVRWWATEADAVPANSSQAEVVQPKWEAAASTAKDPEEPVQD